MTTDSITRARVTMKWCLGALLLLLLAGCARPAPLGAPMPVRFLPQTGELLTSAGEPLTPEDFRRRAETAAYVLVGESHGNLCDHAAERRILTLLAHAKNPPAVGFEMVPRDHSRVIADFAAGKIAPEDLAAKLDWNKTWGHPFAGYLPLFEVLREWNLAAAGLNVPPEVIRRLSAAAMDNATASDPVGSLSPEDRAWLPKRIIAPAEAQMGFLREVMAGHPKGRDPADKRQMARFTLIQSVWDSAMAEAAVDLRRETGRQVAVFAGTAHVDGGLGIARRLAALDPGASVLLVSPWRGDEFDPADADVRVYCPETFQSRMGMVLEKRATGQMGVGGEDDDGWQVVVSSVARGSRAEAAGLRPGDVVTRAGGYRMRSMNALHLAGSDAYREKKGLVLEVRRGGERYTVDLGPLGKQ